MAPPRSPVVRRSAAFSRFVRSYRLLDDIHLPVFAACAAACAAPRRVLYPGSYNHVTASLVFSDVVYVNSDASVGAAFTDEALLEWVHANRQYSAAPRLAFRHADYESSLGPDGSFDLIISGSAGLVSKACARYVREGGHLLLSDAHFDARHASTQPDLELVAVYDEAARAFDHSVGALSGHFASRAGVPLSAEQVQLYVDGKRKAGVGIGKRALFYLFRKVTAGVGDGAAR